MFNKSIFLFLILSAPCIIHSQLLNEFGAKLGPTLTGHFTYYSNGEDHYEGLNLLKFDIGIYAGIWKYRRLSFQAEIHYTAKGEPSDNVTWSPIIPGQIINKPVSNRFQYISFEPLVKFNFHQGKSHYFYLLGGPRWDFRIGNFKEGYEYPDSYIHLSNFKFEFGLTTGLGFESESGLLAEFRFEPNITYTYSYTDYYTSYKKRHSTVMLLVGLNLAEIIGQENRK